MSLLLQRMAREGSTNLFSPLYKSHLSARGERRDREREKEKEIERERERENKNKNKTCKRNGPTCISKPLLTDNHDISCKQDAAMFEGAMKVLFGGPCPSAVSRIFFVVLIL